MRGNRHEITDFGWVHDQDNKKIVRQNNKNDVIIAEEKGYSSYVQVEDSRCFAADKWWKENSKKWTNVRDKWNEIYTRNQDLSLKNKVNNILIFNLFSLYLPFVHYFLQHPSVTKFGLIVLYHQKAQ